MKYTLVLLISIITIGCATNKHDAAIVQSKYAANAMIQEAASKPLFEMSCPATGCMFSSLRVNNPNAKIVSMRQDTNGYDVANKILETFVAVTPTIGMAVLGIKGIENAGRNISDAYNGYDSNASQNSSDIISGDVSGDISGDVSGDISGDIAGDTSGDVISSGDSANDNISGDVGDDTTTSTTSTTTVPAI